MRKLNYILLLCFVLLTAARYGKIAGRKSTAFPLPLKVLEQNANNLQATDIFGNSLIPPLYILLALPG